MKTAILPTLLALTLSAAASLADEGGAADAPKPGVPVKLQVVMTRTHGDTKVASFVYTLSAMSDGATNSLRTGIMVPLKYESKDVPGNVVYKSVGTNLRCEVNPVDAGRFRVSCATVDYQSIFGEEGGRSPAGASGSTLPPVLREFSSGGVLLLRDAQTAQFSVATDPVSGDVMKTDMTLTVVK